VANTLDILSLSFNQHLEFGSPDLMRCRSMQKLRNYMEIPSWWADDQPTLIIRMSSDGLVKGTTASNRHVQ